MISSKDVEEIEAIELILLKGGVPFNEIAEGYAEFLLKVICEESIGSRIDSYERRIACAFLERRLAGSNECCLSIENELIPSRLWSLEKKWRKSRDAFSALIRCVICCYGDEGQWLKDDLGEETPLGVYLFFLKKFNPELTDDFFLYFRKKFLE